MIEFRQHLPSYYQQSDSSLVGVVDNSPQSSFKSPEDEFISRAKNIASQLHVDPMAGWYRRLLEPADYNTNSTLDQIDAITQSIHRHSRYLVCIGIGGSYLGHRAIIEAAMPDSPTEILYAGTSLSAVEANRILSKIQDGDFSVLVISKSGKTLETDIAFRLFRKVLMEKYGNSAHQRIFVITDADHGPLRQIATQEKYTALDMPTDVGGRYSVFTAVGLLPMAVAGLDVKAIFAAAADALAYQDQAVMYAASRQALSQQGIHTEILATFLPELYYFTEWWKQLFGESEGKAGSGIFPASVLYSRDLHSLGQYLQDGSRQIVETFLRFEVDPALDIIIPASADTAFSTQNPLKSHDILHGRSINELNQIAEAATVSAHQEGGIPVLEIRSSRPTPQTLSELMVFFMMACAISAQLSGVNPYDQPGVESYKQHIKDLLN